MKSACSSLLAPNVLSTEHRNRHFLSAPVSRVQQGSRSHGAGKAGSCRAAILGPSDQHFSTVFIIRGFVLPPSVLPCESIQAMNTSTQLCFFSHPKRAPCATVQALNKHLMSRRQPSSARKQGPRVALSFTRPSPLVPSAKEGCTRSPPQFTRLLQPDRTC